MNKLLQSVKLLTIERGVTLALSRDHSLQKTWVLVFLLAACNVAFGAWNDFYNCPFSDATGCCWSGSTQCVPSGGTCPEEAGGYNSWQVQEYAQRCCRTSTTQDCNTTTTTLTCLQTLWWSGASCNGAVVCNAFNTVQDCDSSRDHGA
jgi:hypothetical protein